MKKCEMRYEPQFEKVDDKKVEEKDHIFNMIGEGSPVYVAKKEVCDDGEEHIESIEVSH